MVVHLLKMSDHFYYLCQILITLRAKFLILTDFSCEEGGASILGTHVVVLVRIFNEDFFLGLISIGEAAFFRTVRGSVTFASVLLPLQWGKA
jgi:hypothetical protein